MKIRKRIASIILASLVVFLVTQLLATQCGFLVGHPPELSRWTFGWAALVVVGAFIQIALLQLIFYDLISYWLFKRGIEPQYDEVKVYVGESHDGTPAEPDLKFGCLYPITFAALAFLAWAWTGYAYCD